MQGGQQARGCDLKDRAIVQVGPASRGCPIEVPVVGSHQSGHRLVAVCAVGLSTKTVQRAQLAGWSDFEDRTLVVGPAEYSCPVEVPVVAPNERHVPRISTIRPIETRQRPEYGALCRRRYRGRGTKHEKDAAHSRKAKFYQP